ncbi:dTDP-4-dehydrorhamnose reductase [Tardiphaga sp. 862_B3_N1_1]|uniref:dTDP-4-dehydrorhamnose reductase n=1 Tax=Tardiphaga sp. 862_B3_N1_1 TaxID=3240763 RepID=UPI003F8B07B8
MRVAVVGRSGQVARSLSEQSTKANAEVWTLGRPDRDLTRIAQIEEDLAAWQPDAIVNAAAYTSVDLAENHAHDAYSVNSEGAEAVALVALKLGVPVLHLSTDYVFSGESSRPYHEDDVSCPVSIYGQSKLLGEQLVATANRNHVILRTAWVYSPFGRNFVRTMLSQAADRSEIMVVNDQWGAPSSALDIADGIFTVLRNVISDPEAMDLRGVFHMTGGGATNWAEFASTVFAISARLGGPTARIIPISAAKYAQAAPRPANSQLDNSKIARFHGVGLPHWQQSLPGVVARLLRESREIS